MDEQTKKKLAQITDRLMVAAEKKARDQARIFHKELETAIYKVAGGGNIILKEEVQNPIGWRILTESDADAPRLGTEGEPIGLWSGALVACLVGVYKRNLTENYYNASLDELISGKGSHAH